jgi:hypothetical protein
MDTRGQSSTCEHSAFFDDTGVTEEPAPGVPLRKATGVIEQTFHSTTSARSPNNFTASRVK